MAGEVAAAASQLDVEEALQEAFGELHTELSSKFGQVPSERLLRNWRSELERARAVATVSSFVAANKAEIDGAMRAHSEATLVDLSRVERWVSQRLTFMGVYAADVPLPQLLARLLGELREQRERALANSSWPAGKLLLMPGTFDDRHMAVRRLAYPYRPACGSSHGDEVLNCLSAEGQLAGYIAMRGAYADDLSVDPRFQGRGVAKALVCGVAKRLDDAGEKSFTLDVRACNLPAIELYKSLGFETPGKHYPGFYDWHGGFRMNASAALVAARMPLGFDCTQL